MNNNNSVQNGAAIVPPTQNLLEVAAANGSFVKFGQAIEKAGLRDTLGGEGPFTVFAPTDKAFEALPAGKLESLYEPANKDELVSMLNYHIVKGRKVHGGRRQVAVRTHDPGPGCADSRPAGFFVYPEEPAMSAVEIGGGRQIDVGILGATGMVGQQFIRLLNAIRGSSPPGSPRASDRKAGPTARRRPGASPRRCRTTSAACGSTPARPAEAPQLVFSALDANAAEGPRAGLRRGRPHRRQQRAQLPDGSAACRCSSRRSTPTTWRCSARQRRARGWTGAIVTNPNCSTVVLAMALAPLRPFGLRVACMVTTLQAVSGAGYPGVASLDILGNVVPFICGEEEKMESETQKILGALAGRRASRPTR